ncbi:type VI secretion system Vgr family protein [Sorangium sp. So ce131]|uniref:type VI secretion system Vgr family protein n=1 Tax=Sorangium sp. So ce131 TaxID=3133282 RepID=UPI003F62B559
MPRLELTFESGETSLDVRRFDVLESISGLFSLSILARSPNADIDLESIVGKRATFRIENGLEFARAGARLWTGVCNQIEQLQAETTGLSTYQLQIVPALWLLTQRRNYRIYQHLAIPDIADRIFDEWDIAPAWSIDRDKYPKLEYRCQYGESDYTFLSRLLEEAGIAFTFPDDQAGGSAPRLSDKLHLATPRAPPALPFFDAPNDAARNEYVTDVALSHEVEPGAYTIRDYDFRNPAFPLFGEAPKAPAPEDKYEQYHYQPGALLIEGGGQDRRGNTPSSDDKGVARYDKKYGDALAERALDGRRATRRKVTFETNALDLAPGTVFSIENHPHAALGAGKKLLVTEVQIHGAVGAEWTQTGQAVFADVPYRPLKGTPKPLVTGVQSAIVVGPSGQEIHTDEFGRVRVQFPWDREGRSNDNSSSWIRASQGWAGTGFGVITIPRIGQEVLVGFLEGDPDQPVIVGRVFNSHSRVPYDLPQHKTRSTWKTSSSLGGGGFNEIMFEDLAGQELVFMQAQKDQRRLVKNDETITVGHDRQKLVKANETEVTQGNRAEFTRGDRVELTDGDRTTVVGGALRKLVRGDEVERCEGDLLLWVGGEQHLIVKQEKRELVEKDCHLKVNGSRNEAVGGTQSLFVAGDQHGKVGKNYALEAGQEIHLKAGTALVLEAASDLTIKGPGGFIRIDAGGVTIVGNLVRINSGGAAGSGSGASPAEPEEPREAQVAEPARPQPDDVSRTGIGQ